MFVQGHIKCGTPVHCDVCSAPQRTFWIEFTKICCISLILAMKFFDMPVHILCCGKQLAANVTFLVLFSIMNPFHMHIQMLGSGK